MTIEELKIKLGQYQESGLSWFRKYRNLIIAGMLLLILIIGSMLAFTDWFSKWLDLRAICGWQTNINALQNTANQIGGNLQNLNAQNSIMEGEVNALGENYNRAINSTDDARRRTNQSQQNLNAIERRDFNGTSLNEANRLRCQANPSAPECRK